MAATAGPCRCRRRRRGAGGRPPRPSVGDQGELSDGPSLVGRVAEVLAEVDDLRTRVVNAVEAAEHELVHHPRNEAGDRS